MTVEFQKDKLVINLVPPFWEEDVNALESKINAHLKWLADSLARIKDSGSTIRVIRGSALIGTPSRKTSKKKVRTKCRMEALKLQSPMESSENNSPDTLSDRKEEKEGERIGRLSSEGSKEQTFVRSTVRKSSNRKNSVTDKQVKLLPTTDNLDSEPLRAIENKMELESQIDLNEVSDVDRDNPDDLLTDDESPLPPHSTTATTPSVKPAAVKRSSRMIQSALSAAKNSEASKRVKGAGYRTPSFSSARLTRSKARIKSSSSSSSVVYSQPSLESKVETPLILTKKYNKKPELSRSNSSSNMKLSTPTLAPTSASVSKLKRSVRLVAATPDSKNSASRGKITESAQKRRQMEEERRLQALREKIEKEQRAREKKADYLNQKVLEHKSKREERENKVAILKRMKEEKKKEKQRNKEEADEIKKDSAMKKRETEKKAESNRKEEERQQSLRKKVEESNGRNRALNPSKLNTQTDNSQLTSNQTQNLSKVGEQSTFIKLTTTTNNNITTTTSTTTNSNSTVNSSNKTVANKENISKENLTYKSKEAPNLNKPEYTNYNINDARSDEDTDDERRPKKEVPSWARGETFIQLLNTQFCKPIANREMDIKRIFESAVGEIALEKIFVGSRSVNDKYEKRTSSAVWNSPPSNYINSSFSKFRK